MTRGWRVIDLVLVVAVLGLLPSSGQTADLGNATAIDTCPTASWQVRKGPCGQLSLFPAFTTPAFM